MSNIDEKAKNNFTIEMRIFENYEKVKYEIIKVIDFLRHAETNIGMCRIFDNQNHEFWHSVIKPWFQPERFGITHLWFPSGFSHIGYGEYHIIRSNRWLKTIGLIESIIYLGIGFLPIRNISPIELGF